MRRQLWITLAILAAAGTAAAATTRRVPRDHLTIQAAVDAAENGDTIEISGGKYSEDVVVSGLSELTIVGRGKVTLLPAVTGLTAAKCTNLVVERIGSQGGANGFDFQDCSGVRLQKFSVKDVSLDGVHAAGSTNVSVIKGKISNCGRDGVSFADEEPFRPVNGGRIEGVKVKLCDEDGVDVLGQDVLVLNCRVKDADDDGFEADEDGTGRITFENCKAKNSGDEGFELFADNSTARNCKTVLSDDDGFDVEGDGSRLENCKAVKADSNGIEIELADNVTVVGCKSIRSGNDGFSLIEANDCTLEGCVATKSGDDGFDLDSDTSGCTLRRNKAGKSGDSDLEDDSGGANTIEGNNRFRMMMRR